MCMKTMADEESNKKKALHDTLHMNLMILEVQTKLSDSLWFCAWWAARNCCIQTQGSKVSLIYCRKIKAWKAVCLLRAWSLDWDIWFKYPLQELGGACWVKHSCQKEVSKIQAGKWGTHIVRSVAWGEVWVEIPCKISVIRGPWGREGNPWTPDFLLRQFSVERDD